MPQMRFTNRLESNLDEVSVTSPIGCTRYDGVDCLQCQRRHALQPTTETSTFI